MDNEQDKNVLHGNLAEIDPEKDIISVYQTITLTSKMPQVGNKVPTILEENVIASKEFVDQNHK
ncbi:MAG: hypothetical protein RR036_02320 [Oscillospiraceae bacterium]